MKNQKMPQLLLILFCLASYTLATAQTDYVVTINGDTLTGKVKYLNYKTSQSVQLITKEKKTTYPLLQTRGFALNQEIYHPVRTAAGYTYMKLLQAGYLNLYAYQAENQTTWDGRYLLKKDGEGLDVPNLSFKKYMTRYLADCPPVASKIESGDLSKKEIDKIVEEYNAFIISKSQAFMSEVENVKKQSEKTTSWTELENAIQQGNDFDGRTDALEMISEIKSKIKKNEKVPKFMTDGLQNLLSKQTNYTEYLNKALADIE